MIGAWRQASSMKARSASHPLHPSRAPTVCLREPFTASRSENMADINQVSAHMEIFGADGVRLGTVDKVVGTRIKMTRADSGSHGHHHYVSEGLIAAVEGNIVRLSANADNAALLEEEQDGSALGEQSLFSWRNIGLGAAAAGVAAAAGAIFYRSRFGDED
jgi:hypothetical protein